MTLDRATVEQRLEEWPHDQRLMTVAEERALAEDWLRQQEACPVCGHEWRRHDPEDGKCDAGTPGALDYFEWDKQSRIDLPCPCGRHASYTAMRNAKLSRAALAAIHLTGDGS